MPGYRLPVRLEPQPGCQQTRDVCTRRDPAEEREPPLVPERPEEKTQGLAEALVSEARDTGLAAGGIQKSLLVQRYELDAGALEAFAEPVEGPEPGAQQCGRDLHAQPGSLSVSRARVPLTVSGLPAGSSRSRRTSRWGKGSDIPAARSAA